MGSPPERRRSDRLPTRFPLRYRVIPRGAATRAGSVEDLSAEGVRLRSGEFVPAHRRLMLELQVPGGRPVRAIIEAAWVRERPGDGSYEVGGAFLDRTAAARQTIAGHLRELAAQGSSL